MERFTLGQGLKFRQTELGVLVHKTDFQKTLKISAVFAGVVLMSGVVMFNARNPVILKSSNHSVVPAVTATSSNSPSAPVLGVNIANNGLVFVRGARVMAISGGTIQADMSWGSASFIWVVQTTGTTKFFSHQGQKQVISDIKVGDVLNVTGKLVSKDNQFIINAEFVRE